MSFKKNNYKIIRQAITKDLAIFLANYFRMKKQVMDTCIKAGYISPFENLLGEYEKKTQQIPDTYASYGDIAMETLMLKVKPLMEKETKLKLYPVYAYGRIYKKGDELTRHKDRFSCEISVTMNLGGDYWPIYVSPYENVGLPFSKPGITNYSKAKGVKVDLKPGDMLIYKGCVLEHWRKPFKGQEYIQIFLHCNNQKTKGAKENIFDGRPHLGLPSWFKK